MTDQTMSWLLEEDNPSVRYWTLLHLLGKKESSRQVRSARQAVMTSGPVPELLALQNEDGSWGDPARFYTAKYSGTAWNLILLAEMGADPGNDRVQRACSFILAHAREPEQGGFSYRMSARQGCGLPAGVIPCLTGNMVYSLVKLGCLDDPAVQESIAWIARYQRADDGTAAAPQGDVYERYEMCWGHHSCHMGVAKALKALAAIPSDRRGSDVEAKIGELAEYFLCHHIYKKSRNLDEVSRPGWLKPGFPLMYQTDVFELLEIFASLGIQDSRLTDAIDLVASKRREDGTWKLENSFNGKMLIKVEQKGAASKWITLRALKILAGFNRI